MDVNKLKTLIALLSMFIQTFYPFLLIDSSLIYASSESEQSIQESVPELQETTEESEEKNEIDESSEALTITEEEDQEENEPDEKVVEVSLPEKDLNLELEEENTDNKIEIETEAEAETEVEIVKDEELIQESNEDQEEAVDVDTELTLVEEKAEPIDVKSPTLVEDEIASQSEEPQNSTTEKNDSEIEPNKETETDIWIENEDGSVTTADDLKTDFEYSYKDTKLKIIFTEINNSGTLTISEIDLSEEESKDIDSITDKAYEITSTLENGTFKYNLTLPVPEDKADKNLEVIYFDDMDSIDNVKTFETKPEISQNTITIKDVDHFTVFAVKGLEIIAPESTSTPPFPTKEECLATDDRKITICHATSSEVNPYNNITLSCNAVYSPGEGGHLEENGTPKAGHEDDVMPDENGLCPGEEPEVFEITGHKYDEEGSPIKDWQINLCKYIDDDISNECQTIGFQITNDQGEYNFLDLEKGVYKVTEEFDTDYFVMYPASGTYIVDFVDQVYWPVGNLVMNGGFEYPVVQNAKKWDIYPSETSGLGWKVDWEGGSTSYKGFIRPVIANLELHASVSGWNPKEGLQHAELDTDWDGPGGPLNNEPASVKIHQNVLACENAEFDLFYDWSPRPNHSDNKLEVYWNNSKVGDHSASGSSNTNWNHVELNNLSASGSFTIEFVEKGGADSVGMFLDDVQVIQTNKCDLGEINFYNEIKETVPEKGSLMVCKFEDTNEDTRYDSKNETLLDGWNIRVDEGEWKETYEGCVLFNDLLPGSYSVEEEMQEGWTNTTGNPTEVEVKGNEQTTYYIGNKKIDVGLIKGYKYEDINVNGIWDDGEPTLSNWEIKIGDTKYITDENGYYEAKVSPEIYFVTEMINEGWFQTDPGFVSNYGCEVEINAGEEAQCNFGNYKGGQIQGKKYQDNNANGVQEINSEQFLNGWTIRLYNSDWELVDSNVTSTINGDGEYLFPSLDIGKYYVCEVANDGWTQSGPILGAYSVDNTNITTEDGSAVENLSSAIDEESVCWATSIDQSRQERDWLMFGNIELGTIHGYKWNDINQDGKRDVCPEFEEIDDSQNECETEPLLPDWKIFIDENDNDKFDEGELVDYTKAEGEHYGWYWFENLAPGEYKVCEEALSGWTQTYPDKSSCHIVTLPYDNAINDETSVQNAVYGPTFNFGNHFTEPKLQILKFNSVQDGAILSSRGGNVTYTIQVTALDNNVNQVVVTDLPPGGFKYRLGSWTASSSVRGDIKGSNITTEPTYASPGDWELGDMVPNEVVTLTYVADINDNQDPGIYKDLAWGTGESEVGGSVLAQAQSTGFIDDNFVGTQAKIVVENDSPSDDVDVEEVEEEVEEVEEDGKVLGASTSLPATGSNTSLIYLSMFMLMFGLLSIVAGIMIRSSKRLILNKKVFGIFISLLFFVFGVIDVNAASGTVNVRIQDLESLVKDSFSINYVAMDLDGEEIKIKCYYAKGINSNPSNIFDSSTLKPGGNSGFCSVDKSILTSNGDYSFKVVAETADGDVSESEVVNTKYDSDGPDDPKDLEVDDKGGCKYNIKFTTANDGETSYVEVYRSKSKEIEANESSRVNSVSIGPDEKYEYTDTISSGDCSDDYYYAIRSFDDVGNYSGVVAQEDVKYIVKTVSSSSGSTETSTEGVDSTSSAIVVAEGTSDVGIVPGGILEGEVDTNQEIGNEGDEDIVAEETDEEGAVLGSEDVDELDGLDEKAFPSKSYINWWWIILLPIIVGLFYFVKKRKK